MASKNKLFRVEQTMSRVFYIEAESYEEAEQIKDVLWEHDVVADRLEEETYMNQDDLFPADPDEEEINEDSYWIVYADGNFLDIR